MHRRPVHWNHLHLAAYVPGIARDVRWGHMHLQHVAVERNDMQQRHWDVSERDLHEHLQWKLMPHGAGR